MRARKSSSRQTALTPEAKPAESQERGMAHKVLSPIVQAGLSVRAIHEGSISNLEIRPLVQELSDQMQAIGDGTMARDEEMLVAQAHTLDALFNRLTRLAVGHIGDPEVVGPYLKLALKSQSQCRATVETLGEMKNPKPVNFVQQANIGQNVQVNNGDQSAAREKLKASGMNFWEQAMANGWTPERRARQSEAIRRWQPWAKSTGPKTAEGRAVSSRNADKGGTRDLLRSLGRMLAEQRDAMRRVRDLV